jgi:succinate-semialdehyde dehydrogenase / glutarate-semialdehyde dehydrogenase
MTDYAVIDPTTNEVVRRFPTARDEDVDAAVAVATGFAAWRTKQITKRAGYMSRVAEEYRTRRRDLAAIITREMGKTTREARRTSCWATRSC